MKRGLTPLAIPISGRVRAILDMVKNQDLKDKVLVDVGSSFGWLESKMQNSGFKKVIGIEPNDDARKYAKEKVKNAVFLKGNADGIPLKNSSADIITLFDVIEHVPVGGELAALKEATRVLRKGGKLFLTTPNSNFFTNLLDPAWYFGHRHYHPARIKELLETAGLKVNKIEVRGDIWSSFYFIWLYFSKWVLGQTLPRNKWIEKKEDKGYEKEGIFTLFAEAEK